MGQVSAIEELDDPIDAIPLSLENRELPIDSALEAIEQVQQNASRNSKEVHLADLFSGRPQEHPLSTRITSPVGPRADLLFQDQLQKPSLDQSILDLVPSIEQAHHGKIEDLMKQVEEMRNTADRILEARRGLNKAKDGKLELDQELYDLLVELEEFDCRILDEATKERFNASDDSIELNAETIAQIKSMASSHSDRIKSQISRHFTTKLQPAFSDLNSILETLKKMLELIQRRNETTVRNQIAR